MIKFLQAFTQLAFVFMAIVLASPGFGAEKVCSVTHEICLEPIEHCCNESSSHDSDCCVVVDFGFEWILSDHASPDGNTLGEVPEQDFVSVWNLGDSLVCPSDSVAESPPPHNVGLRLSLICVRLI